MPAKCRQRCHTPTSSCVSWPWTIHATTAVSTRNASHASPLAPLRPPFSRAAPAVHALVARFAAAVALCGRVAPVTPARPTLRNRPLVAAAHKHGARLLHQQQLGLVAIPQGLVRLRQRREVRRAHQPPPPQDVRDPELELPPVGGTLPYVDGVLRDQRHATRLSHPRRHARPRRTELLRALVADLVRGHLQLPPEVLEETLARLDLRLTGRLPERTARVFPAQRGPLGHRAHLVRHPALRRRCVLLYPARRAHLRHQQRDLAGRFSRWPPPPSCGEARQLQRLEAQLLLHKLLRLRVLLLLLLEHLRLLQNQRLQLRDLLRQHRLGRRHRPRLLSRQTRLLLRRGRYVLCPRRRLRGPVCTLLRPPSRLSGLVRALLRPRGGRGCVLRTRCREGHRGRRGCHCRSRLRIGAWCPPRRPIAPQVRDALLPHLLPAVVRRPRVKRQRRCLRFRSIPSRTRLRRCRCIPRSLQKGVHHTGNIARHRWNSQGGHRQVSRKPS